MKKIFFKPSNNIKIPYFFNTKVFRPNLTSELIVRGIENNKKLLIKKKILDMGCGSGVIGIAIKKKIFKNSNVYFSDLSNDAIKLTKKNCKLNKIDFLAKKSNLLREWKEESFDLIINDVSAISSFFLKKKIWYNQYIPSDTGVDGTKQVIKFLKEIKKSNYENVIIPLISLCDTNKIKKIFHKQNFKITSLIKQEWPMPANFVSKEKDQLVKLKNKKKIFFKDLYGFFVANTEILYLKKKK